MIWCISDHGQRHLVDFWEKFPMYLNFIWIEQNSYNSGVLFQIVWTCTSNFKLKSISTEGCILSGDSDAQKHGSFFRVYNNTSRVFHRKLKYSDLLARSICKNLKMCESLRFHDIIMTGVWSLTYYDTIFPKFDQILKNSKLHLRSHPSVTIQ